MLYRQIIAVCSEIHTKHINTLRGQNVEFVNVKPGCIYSNHWALESCSSPLGTDDGNYNYYLTKKTRQPSVSQILKFSVQSSSEIRI